MLIEFKIQLDDNGGVSVVQAPAIANPNLAAQKQLAAVYPATAHAAARGVAAKGPAAAKDQPGGNGPPVDGPGTEAPPAGLSLSPGSGMVFVLGPIVICGSGPGQAGAGGAAPVDGPGTGAPGGDQTPASPKTRK